jgi:hypothetical protein
MDFKIEETKDFIRLLIFLIISPVIGMVMLLGFMAISLAMVCMFIKDFIMDKLEKNNEILNKKSFR